MTPDKDDLRRALRRRRRALAAAMPDAGEALAARFQASRLALPASAALYLQHGSEIDPAPLASWLADRGVIVAMPVAVAAATPLVFQRLGDELACDALGLPCPMPDAPLVQPQIVFTPLLGFDRQGGRIGQGGGFYDRTIEMLKRGPKPPLVIGLAYAGQEVEAVPREPFDQPLDGVLTEKGYQSFA